MRYLVMCEGKNEEVLIDLLLDNNMLNFTRDELIGRRPYPIRQLTNPMIKTELKHYGKETIVYRVGDKQLDELKIPRDLSNIILKRNIYKYCTKPELEMLLILSQGLERKYEKVKSKESPKIFAKKNISFNGEKYDQSSAFYKEYYSRNIKKLVDDLLSYKNYKKHNCDELYLYDLLNDKLKKKGIL